MTTYQEPLQSRRAARQGERADAPPGTLSDPNAEAVTAPPASSNAAPLDAEPLTYATTSRPPLPQYDGQSLRPRRSAEDSGSADLPPTEALPRQDAASYRPKDFSPEGRRAAAPTWAPQYDGTVAFQTQSRDQAVAAAQSSAAPAAAPLAAPASDGEHTMTRRELRALREANGITAAPPTDQTPVIVPTAPPPVAASAESAPVDTPRTDTPPVEEPVALVSPPPLVAPAPQPSTRLDSALAEFDALAAGREPVIPAPDAPAPLPGRRAARPPQPVEEESGVEDFDAAAPAAAASEEGVTTFEALFAAPSTLQPAPDELPELVVEPEPPEREPAPSAAAQLLAPPVVAPAPDPLLSAPAPQGAPAIVPPPAGAYPASVDLPVAPPTGAPVVAGQASRPSSVGHWSTQADIDDAEQVNETTISRHVGAGHGAITTSALVLPSVPEHTIGGPVSGGGEILLTGSISLPQSLSVTGAHPSQLDESDLDHLLDPGDQQVANTDSTPVRAVRAVSTHTATGGIIAPHKPKGTRGFTILIVAASAMAVVVVGLLVAGLVSGTL